MANHQDVANHLRAEYQAARARALPTHEAAENIRRMISDFDNWKEPARRALMATIQAEHSCGNPACPLKDWTDELAAVDVDP